MKICKYSHETFCGELEFGTYGQWCMISDGHEGEHKFDSLRYPSEPFLMSMNKELNKAKEETMAKTEPYADGQLEAIRQGFIAAGWMSPTDNLIQEISAAIRAYQASKLEAAIMEITKLIEQAIAADSRAVSYEKLRQIILDAQS